MSFATMRGAIYNWVVQTSGLPAGQVIFKDQAEHRPARPYAAIKVVTAGTKRGTDEFKASGSTFTQSGRREALVTIDIFGQLDPSHTAIDIAVGVRDTVDQPSIVDEFFSANNIATVDVSDVRDLTDQNLEETTYLSRAQFDVTLAYTMTVDDSSGSGEIDHVTVTGPGTYGTQQIN